MQHIVPIVFAHQGEQHSLLLEIQEPLLEPQPLRAHPDPIHPVLSDDSFPKGIVRIDCNNLNRIPTQKVRNPHEIAGHCGVAFRGQRHSSGIRWRVQVQMA